MAKQYEVKVGINGQSRVSVEGEARLVHIFRSDLGDVEADEVAALVPDLTSDTPKSESAALRLRPILLKLGKDAYEAAIKILIVILPRKRKEGLASENLDG
jgi:hypothetical protein